MLLILSSEEEEGDPLMGLSLWRGSSSAVVKAGKKKRLFSLPIPFAKTWDDLNAMSSEGLDEVAQFRAGQKYLT